MKKKIKSLLEATPNCLIICDQKGNITLVNILAEKLFGYTRDELIGQKIELLIPSRYLTKHEEYRLHYLQQPCARPMECGLALFGKHKDEHEFPVEISISPIETEDGLLTLAVVKDITERKTIERQLEELAHFDIVTRLPNRAYFYDTLDRSIHRSQRIKKEFALLYLDLDDFKKINDSLGHHMGDKFLKHVSQKIQESARTNDFVARLGGDEFVILIEAGTDSLQDATRLAQRIITVFQSPFYIDHHELNSSVSIGIALYPTNGTDATSLMKNADLAMYRAKKSGKKTYQFFSDELNEAHKRQMVIESHLRHAIEKNEFTLVYQPQISLLTGKIYGFEALLRWNTSGLGQVNPAEFVSIAEDMGLIYEIGEWVLESACLQFHLWASQHPLFKETPLVLSVNLSVLQLTQKDLASTLSKLMSRLQFKPALFLLGVTETAIMSHFVSSTHTLKAIHPLGIGVAIDDFGTGYSSLNYLKKLPFTALKIDQSFVQDVIEDSNDASIVTAIIQLGFALELDIIAEGIETEQQLAFLKQAGCHYGQGYYLSYPLSPDELIKFIGEHH